VIPAFAGENYEVEANEEKATELHGAVIRAQSKLLWGDLERAYIFEDSGMTSGLAEFVAIGAMAASTYLGD
jgi:hypothetical protein